MPLASSVRDDDWRIALRQVIEQLAKRNANHKKYSAIRERTHVCFSDLQDKVIFNCF
jgi:hypothetical protein